MAIQINSLSPTGTNGILQVVNNTAVNFNCSFQETNGSFTITGVQWELSVNGTFYNNAPFISTNITNLGSNQYESTYSTGTLTATSNGNFYRIRITSSSGEIAYSNEYLLANGDLLDIGPREIEIVQNPTLFVLTENFDPFYIVPDNGTVTVDTSATYLNRSTSLSSDLNPLTITWQKSYNYNPSTQTGTWTNITNGTVTNEATYSITTSIYIYDTTNNLYAKNSILNITQVKSAANNIYYRVQYTSTNVTNSPAYSSGNFYILVNPTISITRQPGFGTTDTKDTAFCYGAGNSSNGVLAGSSGGDFRTSVAAITTASGFSTLSYTWEYKYFDDGYSGSNNTLINSNNDWEIVSLGSDAGRFLITQQASTLILTRLQYADRYQFRCRISGTIGEPEITSNLHEIYIKDSISTVSSPNPISVSLEDFYGNIINRNLLTDKPVRTTSFSSSINIANYLGQEGNITLQWERSEPGSTTYVPIGNPVLIPYTRTTVGNAQTPGAVNDIFNFLYETYPLRIDDGVGNQRDDGSKYRLKSTSSSVYTYNSSASYPLKKTLTPWYSSDTTLDIFKEIFIITQPSSVDAFSTSSVSFSSGIAVTSGLSTVSYKWQRANNVNNVPGTTWTDLSNGPLNGVSGQNVISGSFGTGTTSTTLLITNITTNLQNYFFRVIVSDPNALSSVTSDTARIRLVQDKFTEISSINDYFVSEYSNVSWTVNAVSLSQGAIIYRWQKSTNYGQLGSSATWNNLVDGGNIQGTATNVLSISTVRNPADVGYYRLKLISQGGIENYSNVVQLAIGIVDITISTNLSNTYTIVEDQIITNPFKILAFSTNGEDILYEWQYKKVGDANFQSFGPGQNFQSDTSNPYTPLPFSKTANWDNAQVRVRLSIPSFSTGVYKYSNIALLDIKRKFFYFADTASKSIVVGSPLSVDLNPSYTGTETPTYAWQYSTNNGATWNSVLNLGAFGDQSILFLASVLSAYNGYQFRCFVTLTSVDQFVYTRNNSQQIDNVTGFGYTATITLNVLSIALLPKFWSQEVGKTGAAVGTVICVPKPSGFEDQNASSVTDDVDSWEVSISGAPFSTGTVSSISTSGNNYNVNKNYIDRGYNWVSGNYVSPKWRIDKDRFPGFIELRGQWLLKSEFPLLYEIIGDSYGSTTTTFKLPNPYGKKIMGTGAVNSQLGRVSVIPLYSADGNSGGDRLLPGTIGGVWNYETYRQLPPGSPGVSGQTDGTAGVLDPSTFQLSAYRTDGWADAQGIGDIKLVGSFTYKVGPLSDKTIAQAPPHNHFGVSAGTSEALAATSCERSSKLTNPSFLNNNGDGGQILDGPSGVPSSDVGRDHSHGISTEFVQSGNNRNSNQSTGKGDNTAPSEYVDTISIDYRQGVTKSLNTFVETSTVTLSNACRSIFDTNLSFYFRNAETIPIISNYHRVKWMIKAY